MEHEGEDLVAAAAERKTWKHIKNDMGQMLLACFIGDLVDPVQ